MKRKKLSIYANPKKYARKTQIPLGLAKIECRKQKQIDKKRKKIRCPRCKRKALHYISGSYEEGYGAFIECDNCGEAFDPNEIKNSELLCYGSDFDAVLYFAKTKHSPNGWIEACGSDKVEDWHKFARNMIVGYKF